VEDESHCGHHAEMIQHARPLQPCYSKTIIRTPDSTCYMHVNGGDNSHLKFSLSLSLSRGSTFAASRLPQGEASVSRHTSLGNTCLGRHYTVQHANKHAYTHRLQRNIVSNSSTISLLADNCFIFCLDKFCVIMLPCV